MSTFTDLQVVKQQQQWHQIENGNGGRQAKSKRTEEKKSELALENE